MWPSFLVLILGNTADVASTYYVLGHNPNAREGNPIFSKVGLSIWQLKALGTVAEILFLWFAASYGFPTAARIIGYAIGIFGFSLATYNLHQLHK